MIRKLLPVASAILALSWDGLGAQTKARPLAIEDYYRVLTVTNPQLAPDGKSVRFSVTTRVESDNGTRTESFTVPADGSVPPTKIATTGGTGRGGPSTGSGQGRGGGATVTSPDGKWQARTQEKPQPKAEPRYASEFEKRHQERFKGVTFDWKDFQRDGAAFPAPNPAAAPAMQIVLQPAGGGAPTTLVDMDLRPSNLAWHPGGQLIAFTADPDFRDELKYDHPDLWITTIDGKVTRL